MTTSCYYGLPGTGKTTVLTRIAVRELAKIRKGRSKYEQVLTNFACRGCGVFDPALIGKFAFRRSLILIDEVTLVWDSRSFKTFPQEVKEFFTLHRHYRSDVIYATQYYQNVDKRIRDVTEKLYRVRKAGVVHVTYQEKQSILYPEESGEIQIGYTKPSIFRMLSTMRFTFGPRYYSRFDTHEVHDGLSAYSGLSNRHF